MNSENKPKKAFEFDILYDKTSQIFKKDIDEFKTKSKLLAKKIAKHSKDLKSLIEDLNPLLNSKLNAVNKLRINKLIKDLRNYRDGFNVLDQDLGDFVSIRGEMARRLLFVNDFVQLDLKTIQQRIKECIKELDDKNVSDEEMLFIGEWIGDVLLIQLEKLVDSDRSEKYFQPTSKDMNIAMQYSLLSYAYFSKRGLKLEANYNARNIRFISKLKTLYPGILMSRNGKGVDGIIVQKNGNNFLDINNNQIPNSELNKSINNFQKYKQNENYSGQVANVLSENVELKSLNIDIGKNDILSTATFMIKYQEPEEFKDLSTLGMLCEYFNYKTNKILDVILVSDDKNTLQTFNGLIRWKLNFYNFLQESNHRFNIYKMDIESFLSNKDIIKEEVEINNNDSSINLQYAQKMLKKITKMQTTIYTEFWEIYAFGFWNVKNIKDEWYKEDDNFIKLTTAQSLVFSSDTSNNPKSNDDLMNDIIKEFDNTYTKNITNRINSYFYTIRLITWNLNDAIAKNPNDGSYLQTKIEILNKLHKFVQQYIDLTINPLTFKDLYEQKIKELNDLITELKPKKALTKK